MLKKSLLSSHTPRHTSYTDVTGNICGSNSLSWIETTGGSSAPQALLSAQAALRPGQRAVQSQLLP